MSISMRARVADGTLGFVFDYGMLNPWRRIKGMISEDPELRRRQKVALSTVVMSLPLLLFSGFVGTAVLFGNPQDRRVWAVIAIVGLAVAIAMGIVGNLVWQRTRMRESLRRRIDEPRGVPQRSLLIFGWVSTGLLPILAVELFLLGRGDDGAAAVAGLFGIAYIAGCFLLWRKLGLKAARDESGS